MATFGPQSVFPELFYIAELIISSVVSQSALAIGIHLCEPDLFKNR